MQSESGPILVSCGGKSSRQTVDCFSMRTCRGAGQLAHRGRVGDQLLVGLLQPVEVLPPLGQRLAAVPVEQAGQQPAGLLLVVAPLRDIRTQRRTDPVQLVGELTGCLGRRAVAVLRPRVDRVAAAFFAAVLEPVAQRRGGAAVVLVVGGDVVEQRLVAGVQPAFERDDAAEAFADALVGAGLAPVERLELLDRVRLLADAHALPHHRVEVDEPLPAQQPIDLGAAGVVPAGQRLEPGRLVGRVVVDVHAGVGVPGADEVIDELFERLLLEGEVGGPVGSERVVVDDAPQVLEPVITEERVALDVEEHVARRRLGQQREPAVLFGREQLVGRLAGVALDQLQPGLGREPLARRGSDRRGQLGRQARGRARAPWSHWPRAGGWRALRS